MFQKTVLKRGLRLITIPMESTRAVTVQVLVGTGSKYEKEKENGISHFLEHMFFKGTKKRPTQLEIAESLDKVGGAYNASTSKEFTFYWAKASSKHLNLILDWVSDIFLNSKIEAKELKKEKGVIVEEINMYQDSPRVYVKSLFEKLLYKDQPAGRLTIGTKQNVKRFKRKDLLEYLARHYTARNTLICVAGKIRPDSVQERIEQYFQETGTEKPKSKPKVVESQKEPQVLVHSKQTDQSHLCLGARGYNLLDEKRYPQSVLATLLGGMMSSRLFLLIRGRGLAYYISSSSQTYTDTGFLVTSAGVDNKRVRKAISAILKQYRVLKEEKVGAKELKKAKQNLKGKLTLKLESSDAQASFYGMQELLRKEILTPDQVFKKIDQVTAEQIQELAKEIFQPEKLNLALIGPFEKKEKFKKLLKI